MIYPKDLKIPLIIGVTGHRDISKVDIEQLESKIKIIFNYISKKYSKTPIILLTPLADGADRIVANIALNNFKDNITVSVPMPFDETTYKKTFGTNSKIKLRFDNEQSIEEFDMLMEEVKMQKNAFILNQIYMPNDGKKKNYSFVGEYIAIHSQILIALQNPYSEEKNGGTAEIVHKKLSGNYDYVTDIKERVDLPERGLVYRIRTPRIQDKENKTELKQEEKYKLSKLFPADNDQGYEEIEWGSNDNEVTSIKKYLNAIVDFKTHLNTKLCITKSKLEQMNSFRREHTQINCLNQLIEKYSDGIKIRASNDLKSSLKDDKLKQRQIMTRSSFAYLSSIFQTKMKQYEKYLLGLILISTFTFFVISKFDVKQSILNAIYILVIILFYIFAIIFKRYKNLYEDTRALSEGLRVQNAWKDLGINESVAFSYPSSYKDELNWIRTSLRSINIFSSLKNSKNIEEKKKEELLVRNSWIGNESKGQIKFLNKYKSYQKSENKRNFLIRYFAVVILVIGGILAIDVIYPFIENKDSLLFLSAYNGLFLTVVSIVKSKQLFDGYPKIIKEYKLSQAHFQRAQKLLEDDNNDKKKIYKSLGKVALQENTFWTILRREKNYKSPTL